MIFASAGVPESPDNEAIRELRDTVKELNGSIEKGIASNERFSLAFAGLALVQIILAIGAYMGDALDPYLTNLQQLCVFLIAIFWAAFTFYKFLEVPKE